MNRKMIPCLLVCLLCFPWLLLATASAETASSFLLTAAKPVDGKTIVTMSGKNLEDLYGYEARFTFDPDHLELVEAKSNLNGFSVSPIIKKNEIIIAHTKIGNVTGESGDIIIGTLTFKTKNYGTSTVKWESMKVVDRNLSNQTFSLGESISVSKGFLDLDGHWAKADIELLASKNIIKGIDEDLFAPEAKVTRAQFTALIARALDLKVTRNQNPFTDVTPGSWYENEVNSAYSAGIIQGKTETSFAPEENISREEMAVLMVRASDYASESASRDDIDTGSVMTFADSEAISEWAKAEVQIAVRLGIMNGRAEMRFVPLDQATRAEAATVMKRLLTSLRLL
ncbi:S-layer homology domain-containing protein [Paenibacillus contaminans]|nr:S-layer homology domain-containing protein [Paenibacillus contaminans]